MSKERSSSSRRVFIETSVFIRFFTRDDPDKAAAVRSLLELIETGAIRPYTSNIVVLEIIFVLTRLYGFARSEVMHAIQTILDLRNLTLIEKANTHQALADWRTHNTKYGDCLIASQVPHGVVIATYDADFLRFSSLKALTPDEIV